MENLSIIQVSPQHLKELIADGVKLGLSANKPSTDNEYEDDILTVEETAAYFKVERQTIYNWSKKGILTPLIRGGRVYFKKSDLHINEDKQHVLFRANIIRSEFRDILVKNNPFKGRKVEK